MVERMKHLEVETLHARLSARLAKLSPLVVADVMRAFLEVSSLHGAQRLVWLEFAFDEDDGRIARIEARFARQNAIDPFDGPPLGYVVELSLPRLIPPRAAADDAQRVLAFPMGEGSLVARFTRALADLGAYRTIESLVALEAETYLL
jgi:hypothetical protein